MIVPVRKRKHTYKIIGTSHINYGYRYRDIMCDLVCGKCGKTKTVYVDGQYEEQIIHLAANGETFNYFDLPRDYWWEEDYIMDESM